MSARDRGAITVTLIVSVSACVFALAAMRLSEEPLIIAMRLSAAAAGIAVVVAYVGSAWRIGRSPGELFSSADYIGVGIVLNWAGMIGLSLGNIVWRLSGRPDWMLDSVLNAFWLFLVIIGGAFQLAAPGAIGGSIPRRNQIVIGVVVAAFVFSVLLFGILSEMYPALAEWLRPVFSGYDKTWNW